ncbi:F0F1 ATP synthase subunit delta [Azomonas macrocytogenes]|uniref:ATP synthase subunit delta n=1 Tax=Azomonas macrocytogenes TaxID=69962 RepID=A0A839T0C5_AZOMA|nr:F0F1 ATP synthase subunit delta [Azomonas macrocytogenes]MBB3103001.1 F-type H+-transporting ATPase subunit delta [Azomonas macrocytogenes]
MINNQTFARPYAKAAFELASESGKTDAWLKSLDLVATLVKVPEVAAVLGNPRLTRESKARSLINLLSKKDLDSAFRNFLTTLSNNDRLEILPTVYELFENLKLEAERTLTVEAETAYELNAEQLEILAASLSKRLDRTVNLQQVVNPALIGGLIIRAGDVVIDGSVRGKLGQLAEALKS